MIRTEVLFSYSTLYIGKRKKHVQIQSASGRKTFFQTIYSQTTLSHEDMNKKNNPSMSHDNYIEITKFLCNYFMTTLKIMVNLTIAVGTSEMTDAKQDFNQIFDSF